MKKTKYIASFLFIMVTMLFVAGCQETALSNDTYVTIDINPSIELIVTPREKVIQANPLNDDGEILLANLELIGLYLEEAIDLIIEEAITLGFIDINSDETIVSVSAISSNSEIRQRIRDRVKENFNNSFLNRGMMGRAIDKIFTPELIALAKELGVAPRILLLAQAVILVDDTLTLEDALLLSQGELIALLRDAKDEMRDVAIALKDEFLAARESLVAQYLPQIQVLEAQIEEVSAAEDDTTELDAQLENLRAEFRLEVEALRAEFRTQSQDLKAQLQALRIIRIQEHRERVQQFRENMETRREEMRDRVKEHQDKRP